MFTCEFLCTVTKAMNHKIQFLFIKNFFTILLICVGLYNHVIRIFKSFMKVSESFIVNMKITSSIFICSPNATLWIQCDISSIWEEPNDNHGKFYQNELMVINGIEKKPRLYSYN